MTIEEMNAKYGRPTTTSSNSGSIADLWGQPQEPQDSFLKTIIKEPIKQLLVKPAARTAEAVGRTGILGENIQKGYESMADTGQKIGGFNIEPVQNDRQVVGEALQTASYLFPYGKVAGAAGKAVGSKLAGNVISGAAGGYTADVGYGLADNTQTTGEALTPGLGTAIGGAIPLVAPATRVAGRALAKTGEKVVDAVIPASSREAQILQTYKANNPFFKRVSDVLKGTDISPTTAGKTTATKSLFGTKSQIGIQAKRAEEKLWNEVISPRLKESTYAVDLDGFFSKIEDDIITNNPEVSRQKSLLNALNSFKDDYAGTKAISLEKLQKLKEGWAEFVPEKFYKGENIAGNAKQVQALLADEARQTIYSQLGDDVKQAYLDYGNLQGLKKMGVVSMTGQKLKGGTGGFVSELFSQAVTPIGTVGGQAIYRVGKGIEFIGNLGAKNLGEALGIQGGMKFPGDMAVDDISATIKKAKSLPNQQGGFIKIGQDANLPTKTQSSQTASKMNSNVISPKSTTKSLKVKGETPSTNLISEAKKYKSTDAVQSWSKLQKENPELFNKGILRKSYKPVDAQGVIPKDVHSAQSKWQNFGEFDEIPASRIYESKMHKYIDDSGNKILDDNGYPLEDTWNDTTQEWIEPTIPNSKLREDLLNTFSTKEGKQYLSEVVKALPKNPDGTITAYRVGKIGDGGVQSYTVSEGMAKTFSNQGTSVLPAGTPGLPTSGYNDFGSLPTNIVKIDPKGIQAWSPYDAEILVESKYVKKIK